MIFCKQTIMLHNELKQLQWAVHVVPGVSSTYLHVEA